MSENNQNTTKRVEQLNSDLAMYWDASPDVIGAFKQLRKASCNEGGVLDFKTKVIISAI